MAFARLLAQLIRLRTHFPDYPIKKIRLDNAATLIRIRPTSYHTSSPLQMVFGQEPNISHLRIFGCAAYVPIAPPQRTKMGPQRRLGIYVGYESPSIIKYLEPSTGDLFKARFGDCHFDETTFPTLGGDKKQLDNNISWNELSLSHLDPRTKQCELEVQRIIHLQRLANQLPDSFTDPKRVTKSHIPAVNAPIKISVTEGQPYIGNESNTRLKRGRPIGSKDKNPRKKKGENIEDGQVEVTIIPEKESLKETLDMMVPDETQVPENEEISINYIMSRKVWNRNKIDVDDKFSYNVALEVMENSEDQEPRSIEECKHRNDWPKWKDAIETELNSLVKREVFGPSTILAFGLYLFLLSLLEVTTKAVSDTPNIGATMDMTSRAGKEARVAMEIAINDFNTKTHKNITLYPKDSKGKVVQAIQNAINLIETHKVDVILGLQTMEEVLAVGEISNEAQIPAFSLLDAVPQWALDRFPFLVQASPSQFAQMKAFVAIMESYGWNRFTFIYEDINLASIQVIPYLMETIKESGVHMSSIINLSPLTSSTLLEELERINSEQSRVFLVHASLETSIHLFQNAKSMGMMESGYVWITTNLITDLLYTVNSSTFLTMEGVVGLGSFFPETGSQFHDFSTKFQSKFKIQHPEEENNMPGIFAVQAYDATWIAALTMSLSTQTFLEAVSSISFAGIAGEVQIVNQKSTASHRFQIVNVIGKYYRQLGFWSEGLGFSKVIDDKATYETLMHILGPIIWPGRPLNTPRGWGDPTSINHLRVGVPTMAMFKKFVEVKYNDTSHSFTYTGYSIELFNETIKRLRYNMSYEFIPFTGTYDSLVEQVYLKKFDVVVGDVSVVSWRYKYVDFTYPYTETGLVMIVPLTSHHDSWLFVKPFTLSMWALTIILNIYCGFVVWLIERKNSPELQGSPLNQAGILFSLAFTRMFYTNVDDVSSNLTRMTIMAWFFAAIIIGQCYTASLTSMLTVRKLIPQVTDYETLKKSNAIVGYDQGSQVASYLVDVLGFKRQNIRPFTSPEEYAHALGKKEIAAVFLVAPYAKLFLTKYCKMSITAGNTFGEAGFGFAFPKGSPMVSDFTKALLNMSESGALRDFKKRMLGSERCEDLEGNQDDYDRLGIDSFWSLFLLAGGISTLALVIYVIKNHCLFKSISEVRKCFVHQQKRLSRKVSDVEGQEGPNAVEIT
ncbi:hypothetical protein E3N88_05411 [Mikania micrantha]|uniref:Ionotropic glutamate receptor C-terminal domain-containing protein n=1 Tax=Mikania micrantha TaxID=192012 RepID=A0A5N6PMT0_9ASTR|nr:hypothetical protein E3N88_05411 [Mikania micrantha]